MSDRPVKLVILDQDPIFRTGLCSVVNATPECEVIWDGDREVDAWEKLRELSRDRIASIYLLLLELGDGRTQSSLYEGIRFCQEVKQEFPQIPILVFSAVADMQILTVARNAGVDGWCIKGSPIAEILTAIASIVSGQGYWEEFALQHQHHQSFDQQKDNTLASVTTPTNSASTYPRFLKFRQGLRRSGNQYINTGLRQVQQQLKVPGLPLLERVVLVGRSRELLAAKWLIDRIFPSPHLPIDSIDNEQDLIPEAYRNLPIKSTPLSSVEQPPRGLQAELLANCAERIQQPLVNISEFALEIDILRSDKKRELLYLILQNFANQLEEVRTSQLAPENIHELLPVFIRDLWQNTVTTFFGKFARIQIDDYRQNILIQSPIISNLSESTSQKKLKKTPTNILPESHEIEISQLIINDFKIVETAILAKIPRIDDLILYLIYQTDWHMENEVYPATLPEAKADAQIILENLLIQVANATIQPLINRLADIESIKQNFYARQMLSSREIERFRNNLSWKYRFGKYYLEPKAIFESRYYLLVFATRGIAQTSVYAPRQSELAQLKGIPLAVTVGFEFRDAIAPRLQSLVSVLGSAVVFVLTQVVGRGLGLVARGILQGIGHAALPNSKNRKI